MSQYELPVSLQKTDMPIQSKEDSRFCPHVYQRICFRFYLFLPNGWIPSKLVWMSVMHTVNRIKGEAATAASVKHKCHSLTSMMYYLKRQKFHSASVYHCRAPLLKILAILLCIDRFLQHTVHHFPGPTHSKHVHSLRS